LSRVLFFCTASLPLSLLPFFLLRRLFLFSGTTGGSGLSVRVCFRVTFRSAFDGVVLLPGSRSSRFLFLRPSRTLPSTTLFFFFLFRNSSSCEIVGSILRLKKLFPFHAFFYTSSILSIRFFAYLEGELSLSPSLSLSSATRHGLPPYRVTSLLPLPSFFFFIHRRSRLSQFFRP